MQHRKTAAMGLDRDQCAASRAAAIVAGVDANRSAIDE